MRQLSGVARSRDGRRNSRLAGRVTPRLLVCRRVDEGGDVLNLFLASVAIGLGVMAELVAEVVEVAGPKGQARRGPQRLPARQRGRQGDVGRAADPG